MKNLAQVVTWVVLLVVSFYTMAGLAMGTTPPRISLLYPIVTLVATLTAYRHLQVRWLVWGSIGLNVVFGAAAIFIILFGQPPLWWSLLIGGGAILGSSV